MAKIDYEIRTPDKKILLFTCEERPDGNLVYVAKKGNRSEGLTFDTVIKLLIEAKEDFERQQNKVTR